MTLHAIYTTLRSLGVNKEIAFTLINQHETINNDWKRKAHCDTWVRVKYELSLIEYLNFAEYKRLNKMHTPDEICKLFSIPCK